MAATGPATTGRKTSSTASRGQEGANSASPIATPTASPIRTSASPMPAPAWCMPAALTGPHSAGLGIKFYTGTMFPQTYRNVAFIARHGSWNREKRFGYDVVIATDRRRQGDDRAVHDRHARRAGRTSITAGRAMCSRWPDGSLLVSDELHGAIYRISYSAPAAEVARLATRRDELVAAAGSRAGGCCALRGARRPARCRSPSASSCAARAMARTAIRACQTSLHSPASRNFILMNQMFLFREGVRNPGNVGVGEGPQG